MKLAPMQQEHIFQLHTVLRNVCVQIGLSVACYSLALCLASTACERTVEFAYAAMYISVAFNTHHRQ